MTSKLMGMKFMQRAAANASSSPAGPTSQSTPKKRQKLANGVTSTHRSSSPQYAPVEDNVEGQKLAVILNKQAEASGDTHWGVGTDAPVQASPSSGLRVVTMGYDVIDTPERNKGVMARVENSDAQALPCLTRTKSGGRMSFGKRKVKTAVSKWE